MTQGRTTGETQDPLDRWIQLEEPLMAELEVITGRQSELLLSRDVEQLAELVERRGKVLDELSVIADRIAPLVPRANAAQRQRMLAVSECAARVAAQDAMALERLAAARDEAAAGLGSLAASSRAHGAYGAAGPQAPAFQDREA
ncbi:MAG: hypothetical protein ACOYN0_02910 [Phycisphaerales bacterium]